MNAEARDLLVAAALRGHRQIKDRFHDPKAETGECALGVLHLACHASRQEALACVADLDIEKYREVKRRFDLSSADVDGIWKANDHKGWDFLQIANKLGLEPEEGA